MLPDAYCVNVVCMFAVWTVFMHGAEFLLTVGLFYHWKKIFLSFRKPFLRDHKTPALLEW